MTDKPLESLTRLEFHDIIDHACALQQADERRRDRQLVVPVSTESLTLSEVYQIAAESQIPREYVERALRMVYPSVDEQLADIKRHGAIPTGHVIFSTYKAVLLDALKAGGSGDNFAAIDEPYGSLGCTFSTFRAEEQISGFLLWKKTIKVRRYDKLSNLQIYSPEAGCAFGLGGIPTERKKFDLEIRLWNPLFLHACGQTLEKLNEEFRDQLRFYEVSHNYRVK